MASRSARFRPPRRDEVDTAQPVNFDSSQAQGLIAWWPLWLMAGVSAGIRDWSANRYPLTPAAGAASPTCVADAVWGRAFNFASASSQYTSIASAVLAATPLSLFAWVYSTNDTASQDVITIWSGSINEAFRLNLGGATAGDPVRAITTAGGSAAIATSGTYPNKWAHVGAVYASGVSRRAYCQGSGGTVETTNRVPSGVNATQIGGITSAFLNGRVADARIYNRALSAADVFALWAPETRFDLVRRLPTRRWFLPSTSTPNTVPVLLNRMRGGMRELSGGMRT